MYTGLPKELSPSFDLPVSVAAVSADNESCLGQQSDVAVRGFAESYFAHCDIRRVVPNDEIALLAAEFTDRALDLSILPGIEGDEDTSNNADTTVNIEGVLRHDKDGGEKMASLLAALKVRRVG